MVTGGKRAGAGRPSQLEDPTHRAYRLETRQVHFLAMLGAKRGRGATSVLREIIDLAEHLHKAGKLEAALKRTKAL